jgi:hypothetical protein
MVTWPLLEILLVNGILFTLYFKGTLFYAQNQARLGQRAWARYPAANPSHTNAENFLIVRKPMRS